ncbi:hypothetical protein D3C85_1591540 [compost metagenome]
MAATETGKATRCSAASIRARHAWPLSLKKCSSGACRHWATVCRGFKARYGFWKMYWMR